MRELKSYSRSIRMTEKTRKFVEDFKGEGFNEKFENLITYCFDNKTIIDEKTLKGLELLENQSEDIRRKREIINNLEMLQSEIFKVIRSYITKAEVQSKLNSVKLTAQKLLNG